MPARRITMLLALALALVAGAAKAAEKLIDPKKVFPFLDAYWKLPPAERSLFAPAYVFRRDGRPLSANMAIVRGSEVDPIPLRADGYAARLPSAAELQSGKLRIEVDREIKLTVNLELEAALRPAAQYDPRELRAILVQATAAERKVGGVLGFMAPRLTEIVFEGVPGGEVRFADGRKAPLPLLAGGRPFFDPDKFPGAVGVALPGPPARVTID